MVGNGAHVYVFIACNREGSRSEGRVIVRIQLGFVVYLADGTPNPGFIISDGILEHHGIAFCHGIRRDFSRP